ncbi:MAG: DUF1697 domain-containing protein [Candidatus Kapaibacterium sp.]
MGTKRYVAFLRGINVGGNKKVPMEDLKKALASLGYKNISTLLNSGNAIFETTKGNSDNLTATIEEHLKKKFGFEIPTLVRTLDDITTLVNRDPFKGIEVTPQIRLYVSFLSEKPHSKLKLPYQSSEKSYTIRSVSDGEVCSILTLSGNTQSTDLMNILEKEFGKKITTRNWNTIVKILEK